MPVTEQYQDNLDRSVFVLEPDRFHAVRVERCEKNALIMRRLDNPVKNFSKQDCLWELEYRWLSREEDELVCVQGNEFAYYPDNEYDESKPLFEQFQLF